MKIIKFLILFIFLIAVIFGSFLLYTEKTLPKFETEETIFEARATDTLKKDTLSILSWNIGYAGLGSEMDFFYDGGTRMQTSKKNTIANLNGILTTLKQNSNVDFMLLQEVDKDSKRSYSINEIFDIGQCLKNFSLFFAPNYIVELIPLPITNPLGKVNSGILSLTKQSPNSAIRYSYPDKHPWPAGLFMPKRCFLVLRFTTADAKELLVINTHSSAYDNGELRKQELNQIKDFAEKEYKRGNYVVVGGDWNQNPPAYIQQNPDAEALEHFKPALIPTDLMPNGWSWVTDQTSDSNRFLNIPFEEGKTMTTTIDFFLISPNITALEVKTTRNNFKYSDHQPIKLKFTLKKTTQAPTSTPSRPSVSQKDSLSSITQ